MNNKHIGYSYKNLNVIDKEVIINLPNGCNVRKDLKKDSNGYYIINNGMIVYLDGMTCLDKYSGDSMSISTPEERGKEVEYQEGDKFIIGDELYVLSKHTHSWILVNIHSGKSYFLSNNEVYLKKKLHEYERYTNEEYSFHMDIRNKH